MARTKTLGEVVRERRLELGLSQNDLAAVMGDRTGQTDISRIELGKTETPRRERLDRLAAALGLDADELVARTGWVRRGAELFEGTDYWAIGPDPLAEINRLAPRLLTEDLAFLARLARLMSLAPGRTPFDRSTEAE
ncbi:MAG: XRE family transcriptional regulator [Myxococcales bacterium]|nr:MAG: XRE family transcriptional regulator [Myxococcales bacterium]